LWLAVGLSSWLAVWLAVALFSVGLSLPCVDRFSSRQPVEGHITGWSRAEKQGKEQEGGPLLCRSPLASDPLEGQPQAVRLLGEPGRAAKPQSRSLC
jgi:hypothetical protein